MDNLSDLEICKRVSEIENLMFCTGGRFKRIEIWKDGKVFKYEKYNPLTDDALCFKLMVKYNVEIQITQERDKVDKSRGEYAKQYYAIIKRLEVMNKDIKRAILLCIIEAHKDTGNE